MTFGERLAQLSGKSGVSVAVMLAAIGTGATFGSVLVNYSGLPTGTVSEHLLVNRAVTAPITLINTSGSSGYKGKLYYPVEDSNKQLLELREQEDEEIAMMLVEAFLITRSMRS